MSCEIRCSILVTRLTSPPNSSNAWPRKAASMSFSSMLASAAGAAAGAVAKAVAGGPTLPFETGEEVKSFAGKSCWKLHSGKKEDRATGKMQDVSLFLFDMKDRAPAEVAAAKNGMRRMRTIKHPYLLKCFDAGEVPDNKGGGVIWIATEPVQPLDAVIESLSDTPGALAWGVYTLAAAVNFLNMDASSIHGQAPPPPSPPARPSQATPDEAAVPARPLRCGAAHLPRTRRAAGVHHLDLRGQGHGLEARRLRVPHRGAGARRELRQ